LRKRGLIRGHIFQPETYMSRSISLDETLTAYVRNANRAEHPALKECRLATDAMGDVSRMQISPEQGSFLQLCARLVNAKTAVEVGVFTGYSALATALAMKDMHGQSARLYGCDISEEYTDRALPFWAEAGVSDLIELHIGDARQTLGALKAKIGGQADMIFIDADKTGYDAYYEAGLDMLRPGGLFLFDNVLWSGDVADPAKVLEDPDTAALKALADKIRDDDRVDMAFTSIGDGILMAVKR
jgi:O-methyltransferase